MISSVLLTTLSASSKFLGVFAVVRARILSAWWGCPDEIVAARHHVSPGLPFENVASPRRATLVVDIQGIHLEAVFLETAIDGSSSFEQHQGSHFLRARFFSYSSLEIEEANVESSTQ